VFTLWVKGLATDYGPPAILHNDANPVEVQKVLDQPDFASFDRQMEGEPDWFPPAIHAGGHFGIGGMLGQAGNAANSPGGKLINPTSPNNPSCFC
jgi:tyrosinase